MNPRAREMETLLLTMFAASPLYLTNVVSTIPLVVFHVVMAGMVLRVASGRSPELVPVRLMRVLAFVYIGFYIVDAAFISRSAIAASTHLVLFIAAYQPIESITRNNHAQRLLTTALIFIASLATSTHISVVLFVIAFAFLMLRQMIYVSHVETVSMVERPYALEPTSRAALFYLAGTAVIAAGLFPLLPRLRNPVMQGFAGALNNATTGLSDSIDFNRERTSSPDPAVVARVWMSPEAIAMFTPLRLRGAVYDSYHSNRWMQTRDEFREMRPRFGVFQIARASGPTRTAVVQQRLIRTSRLFLPSGTYAVQGLRQLYEGPTRDAYVTMLGREEIVRYEVSIARRIEPLRLRRVPVPPYLITPEIAALARQITAGSPSALGQAQRIEKYLLENFQYVQRPEQLGKPMSVDEFLLRVRKGHCEYFAAGMVALLSAQDIPSRIVGGFYGGRLNPLTGYFVIRREDAHAWVEMWDGQSWRTFDPTPPSLRPGNSQPTGLESYVSALSESVNYFWDRYVLTYGLGDQIALAAETIVRAREGIRNARSALGSARDQLVAPRGLAAVGAIAVLVALLAFTRRGRRPVFHLLARHLRGLGIEVGPAMTIEEALVRLRAAQPEAAGKLEPLARLYEEEQFSPHTDAGRRKLIRQKLAELRT